MTKNPSGATRPILIDQPNLSAAWAEAMLHVVDNAGTQIAPLVISVSGFDADGTVREDPPVRQSLDSLLAARQELDVEGVAYTIFPNRLWKMAKGDRAKLFNFYRMAYPRYQAMNRRLNGRGLYFGRLTSFGTGPCDGNQLEWILSQHNSRKGVRKSMFQASIFDPARDHVSTAQLGFPCLQHVSFEPTEAGLVINAFYATQQLFVKAYGNYLGLARLGSFMALEMRLPMARLNVMIGVAKLERISKTGSDIAPLVSAARDCVRMHSAKPGLRALEEKP